MDVSSPFFVISVIVLVFTAGILFATSSKETALRRTEPHAAEEVAPGQQRLGEPKIGVPAYNGAGGRLAHAKR